MSQDFKNSLLRVILFLIAIVGIAVAVKRKRVSAKDLGLQAPVSYQRLFTWWGLFLLLILATELLLFKIGLLEVKHWHHNLTSSIVRVLGIVVLAPIAEELLFRGMFLYKLTQWMKSRHVAVLVQSLVFVLLHSFAYENTLSSNIGIAQTFIDATLYAYARFNTQSIYTSIAMHATGNLVALLEQFIF